MQRRTFLELRRVKTLEVSSVTTLHAAHGKEGGLDEPFKAGCRRSVLRLDDKLNRTPNPGSSDVTRFAVPKRRCRSPGGRASVSTGVSIPQSLSNKLERQKIIQDANSNNCCTALVEVVHGEGEQSWRFKIDPAWQKPRSSVGHAVVWHAMWTLRR